MLKNEKYMGYKITFAESENYRGTKFVNVLGIFDKNGTNIQGHNIIDGWNKEEAFNQAKSFINLWVSQGG